MTRFVVYAAALLAALVASPAVAHPHIWIDARTDFVFDPAGRLTAIAIRWTFDELYSVFAVKGLDKNRDGKVDSGELAPLVEEMMTSLKAYDYFSFLRADGEAAHFASPVEAGATFENGALVFRFTLPLAEPIDARRSDVAFTMYDPTFFAAIELANNQSVQFTGAPPADCTSRIAENSGQIETKSLSEVLFQDTAIAGSIAAAYAQWIRLSCPENEEQR
jgi:ABC-type uncharacterized transport system substrate-binding protein